VVKEGLYLFEARCAPPEDRTGLVPGDGPSGGLCRPDAVDQVLTNLVVNAVQAMPGGGKLSVETRADAEAVILRIEDTGEGMSPEVKKQIFLPFLPPRKWTAAPDWVWPWPTES